jgi:hypothetical protein
MFGAALMSWTANFTAWAITAFSALLVVVTGLQFWAYIQSERAFLVIDDLKFYNGEPTAGGVLIFKIKNPGKTVATIQTINLSSYLGALSDNAPLGTTTRFVVAIAPGDQFNMRATFSNPEIFTPQVISALVKGEQTISMFGFIKYDNGYNWFGLFQPAEVGYCFTYVPPTEQYGGETFEICKNPRFIYTHEFRPNWASR